MANQYLQQLTGVASVLTGYVIPVTDDPSGTARLKKATVDQLKSFVLGGGTLGALAFKDAVDLSSADVSGTIAAARMPAHTGDVTNTVGSLALTIGSGKVTNTMLVSSSISIGTSSVTLGSSVAVLAGLTSVACPLLIGGPNATSSLTLKSTSGIGIAGADIIFLVGNNGATEAMRVLNSGDVGIGVSASVKLHVVKTTEQLRLGYDGSNYSSFAVGSSGSLTLGLVGTSSTFALAVNGTTVFSSTSSAITFGSVIGDTIRFNGATTYLPNGMIYSRTSETGTAESIVSWTVSDDTSSFLAINNATSTNSSFTPRFYGQQSAAGVAMNFTGAGTTDTGTSPILLFTGQLVSGSAVSTRPLIQFRNLSTTVINVNASGDTAIGNGATAASARMHLIKTTEQLRVGYDASNYVSFTVSSSGSLTLALTGTTPKFIFGQDTSLTKIYSYNNITTVSNGVPSELATVDLTAQSAAISATSLYTPITSGMFRISAILQVTRAATTSCTLGGATGLVIAYTEPDGSVAQSDTMAMDLPSGSVGINSATNTTANNINGSMVIYAKSGVAITYAIGYTSSGATTMQYSAHIKVEAL